MRRCQKDLHDVPEGAPLCVECRRASRRAYKTRHPAPPADSCGAGHAFTPATTRVDAAGRRRCTTCAGRPRPRPLRARCRRDLHDLTEGNVTASRGCKACARAARARRVEARLAALPGSPDPASRAEPARDAVDAAVELVLSLMQAVHHRDEEATAALLEGLDLPALVTLVVVQSRLLADAHRVAVGARAA